jgi:hypothetical protein
MMGNILEFLTQGPRDMVYGIPSPSEIVFYSKNDPDKEYHKDSLITFVHELMEACGVPNEEDIPID